MASQTRVFIKMIIRILLLIISIICTPLPSFAGDVGKPVPVTNNNASDDDWGDWSNAPNESISDSELLNQLDNSNLMDYDSPSDSESREESSDYMLFRQLEEELLQDLDQ